MKSSFRFIFLAVTVLANTLPSLAQWVQTNGPYGGDISSRTPGATS